MEWWKEGVGKREGGKKVDWREVIFEDEKFGCFFFFFLGGGRGSIYSCLIM